MIIKLAQNSYLVETTLQHVDDMAPDIRREDDEEAVALGFSDARSATISSLLSSHEAWTWMIDGKPGCIMGISPGNLLSYGECIWFVSTDKVEKHKIHFLRTTKKLISEILNKYSCISNVVDARYTRCIAWLKWLGFNFYEAEEIGKYGEMFYRFDMRIQ